MRFSGPFEKNDPFTIVSKNHALLNHSTSSSLGANSCDVVLYAAAF